MESIFSRLEEFDPKRFDKTLPHHSSPLLARFARVFNQLVIRLKTNERELSHWVYHEVEQSRFQVLGEMSALVTHDLANPIHVIDYCARKFQEDPNQIFDKFKRDQLAVSASRSRELIESLKAYLKDTSDRREACDFLDCHQHVLRLIEMQFSSLDFARVRVELVGDATGIQIALPRSYLVHILLNIYGNSFQNLIGEGVAEPRLVVELQGPTDGLFLIMVSDNGTSLSRNDFERMTAFSFQTTHEMRGRSGLGLRLIRRLIEQNGGQLRLVEPPRLGRGSSFVLELTQSAKGHDPNSA